MTNYDSLKLAVEGISGGKTTILMDNADLPTFMNQIAKRTMKQLITECADTVHPAFIVDSVEKDCFYFSKFINCVINSRAYSWPNVIPTHSLVFDTEMTYCNNKGTGFHLTSAPEWDVIMRLIKKSGFEPRGNTNYGSSHSYTYEAGRKDSTGRTATGSGPVTWNTDGDSSGISDFVGDVWKRLSAMRLKNGEIQIMAGNMAANQVSHADTSTYWKAVMPDGSLVDPGTSGTLHVNASGNIGTDVVTTGSSSKAFSAIAAANGITIPDIIKANGLATSSTDGCGNGTFYYDLSGERIPLRGGGFDATSYAGPCALSLNLARSLAGGGIGFFSSYQA